jgi:hypothetical protein
LAIDRVAIQRVLLDREGEITGALLPEWLSGYAFLFPATHDLSRAKTLAHDGASLLIGYDRSDVLLRSLAERISVDSNQVGLKMQPSNARCDVRLMRLPISSTDPSQALRDIAAALDTPLPSASSPYEAEHELLRDFRVVPLFHLPVIYALSANVRNWSEEWPLADVWLEPKGSQ